MTVTGSRPEQLEQSTYPELFEPLQLRGVAIGNRIVFGAHRTNFAEANLPAPRHLDYYMERARGGAGLIIFEEGIVHNSDYPYEKAIFAYKQEAVEHYKNIVTALHRCGTRVLLRLNHWGMQGTGMINRREIWGPSSICVGSEMPKEMELEDIDAVINGFARSAQNAFLAGIDGVEINAGQHSLLRQFFSPLTNTRQDEYGGSLENRARLCRRILEQVRAETGEHFIIGLRLTMDEYAPWAGITPEMGTELAAYFAASGTVDFFSVSVGSVYSQHMTVPTMVVEEGFTRPYGEMLKKTVALPVMVGGRITGPRMANQVLLDGQADLVELTRAQIADPWFAHKTHLGRESTIRPCLSCNQGCRTISFQNRVLSCAVNWLTGRENTAKGTGKKGTNKKGTKGTGKGIAVIGAGPAGMEAAAQAAHRGYRVDLFEKAGELGGNLRLAGRVPGRAGVVKLIGFYKNLLNASGVQIKLGQDVSEKSDLIDYAAVIVATGAKARPPAIRGKGSIPVVSGLQLWSQGLSMEWKRILITDEDGFHRATGLIESLAGFEKEIIVVTSEMFCGIKLTDTDDFNLWYQRVKGFNVTFIPHHRIVEIDACSVLLEERFSGKKQLVSGLDAVVCCDPPLPAEELFLKLKSLYPKVYRAGDCVAPRTYGHAIHEGYMTGISL